MGDNPGVSVRKGKSKREVSSYHPEPPKWAESQISEFTRRLIQARNREQKMKSYFETVKCFDIEPMPLVRERLDKPMTDEERALRKQWVLDQKLAPNEPRFIPETRPRNPFRKLYHGFYDGVEKLITPVTGQNFARRVNTQMRQWFGIFAVFSVVSCVVTQEQVWTNKHGFSKNTKQRALYPGDPNFPHNRAIKEFEDFNDKGFSQRTVYRN